MIHPILEFLIEEREALGLTTLGLAKRAQLPRSQLYKWEKGQHSPAIDKLDKLCAALGCELMIRRK